MSGGTSVPSTQSRSHQTGEGEWCMLMHVVWVELACATFRSSPAIAHLVLAPTSTISNRTPAAKTLFALHLLCRPGL